mmetsp:Transcript_9018/g.40993  ORF Transcript_9018/g.40993 Transcript_9018/m.40993 type:complete len:228 (+) Transcript_9018:502-1185(+)
MEPRARRPAGSRDAAAAEAAAAATTTAAPPGSRGAEARPRAPQGQALQLRGCHRRRRRRCPAQGSGCEGGRRRRRRSRSPRAPQRAGGWSRRPEGSRAPRRARARHGRRLPSHAHGRAPGGLRLQRSVQQVQQGGALQQGGDEEGAARRQRGSHVRQGRFLRYHELRGAREAAGDAAAGRSRALRPDAQARHGDLRRRRRCPQDRPRLKPRRSRRPRRSGWSRCGSG